MQKLSLPAKILLGAVGSLVLLVLGLNFYFAGSLPDLDRISNYQPPLVTRIYNPQGQLVGEFADEHRILVPFEQIPLQLRLSFLAAEDEYFYKHPGINPSRIISAMLANILAGGAVQGASTITQQVAKNFFLSPERTMTRKIREMFLAYRIEQAFTKDEILYLYLNHIYLGRGAYGVGSAAWRYYHKTLDQLTLAECAMLASLPKSPSTLAPHINPKAGKARRDAILRLMERNGFADSDAVEKAIAEPIKVAALPESDFNNAFANAIYSDLSSRFGEENVRRQGLTIVAPYDPEAQRASERAVRKGVLAIESRQLYRFPRFIDPAARESQLRTWATALKTQGMSQLAKGEPREDQIFPALVEEVLPDGGLRVNDGLHRWQLPRSRWYWVAAQNEAEKRHGRNWIAGDEVVLQGKGDGTVRLTQMPSVQGALYSVDLRKGTVLARVGGFDFKLKDFDHVDQGRRQPGSAFKPFLYATALELGHSPAEILMDTPLVFDIPGDATWRPDNYKDEFAGPVTLRDALEHSRNLASIRLLQDIGIGAYHDSLKRFPFNREFPPELGIALGTTEVTLSELTEAYIVLASGEKWKPVAVQQVQDRDGSTLHRSVAGNRCQLCHADPVLAINDAMKPSERVLDAQTSFLITNVMKGVIDRGTGAEASKLGRPAAGKTGTTNDQIDAWFMAYTPQILTGVWVGRDTPTSMGGAETGAQAALPIWLDAMSTMHRNLPVEQFVAPEGIEWVTIDRKSGRPAGPGTEKPIAEAFRVGTPISGAGDPYAAPGDGGGGNNKIEELGL